MLFFLLHKKYLVFYHETFKKTGAELRFKIYFQKTNFLKHLKIYYLYFSLSFESMKTNNCFLWNILWNSSKWCWKMVHGCIQASHKAGRYNIFLMSWSIFCLIDYCVVITPLHVVGCWSHNFLFWKISLKSNRFLLF